MLKRIQYIIAVILSGIILCCTSVHAQQESDAHWEYKVFAAYNLGGTTPVPLPAEIRKIKSWSPGLAGTMAFQITRWLTPRWGVTTGLGIDIKGMKIEADVLYWQTNLVVGEGDQTGNFSGIFSGKNTTKTRNSYIVLPVMAAFHPFERWTFRLGGYLAFQQNALFEGTASDGYIREGDPTGDYIKVDYASFDFSDKIKTVDAGLIFSTDWKFTRNLAATGQLSWGLTPVFPSHFEGISYKMYNIYVALGIAYFL